MKKLKNIIIAITLSLSILNPVVVLAQTTSTAINVAEYTGVQGSITQFLCTPSEGKADGKDIERCINKLYRFGIAFGGIALVFFLVYAGYLYIVGGESGKGKAKGIIQNAFIGIALLLGSYVILYFINPNLTIIKPIQPPIFTAGDFPSCEEVGFEETCVLPGGEIKTGSGEGGWGERISCPGNKLVSAKGLGLPTKAADEQICEEFGKKLLGLKTSLSGVEWRITDTIGSGHGSSCHSSGNNLSGTCADIGLIVKSTANFNKVCKALMAIGDLQPVNETEDPAVTECGKLHNYGGTGPHLHVNWRKGNGGGGGGTSGGGSRPYCKPNKDFSFLCDSPSGSPWSDDRVAGGKAGFTSSDPAIQANLTELKKRLAQAKVPEKNINQSYRPHEYSSHMRSFWEASALISGKTDAQVNKKGFYCDGSIQFVKKADIDKLTKAQKDKIVNHASLHDMNKWDEPTTCLSDHGFGYAVDVDGANPANMEKFGLCRNLQGPKWNQRLDAPHYVLKEKNRNTEGCK